VTKTVPAALVGALFLIVRAHGADCAACHPAEVHLHERSRMANAMLPALATAFAANLPDGPLRESNDGFALAFARGDQELTVHASRGVLDSRGTIRWILGAGAQGQTPLVRSDHGDLLESRVSYFPKLQRFGITIGQNAGASPTAAEALGFRHTEHDTQECIACHATAVTKDFEPAIPGVQCQRCHAGADEHAQTPAKLPVNPGRLKAANQVRFCGTCHRSKPPVDDHQLENVRFQPLRLAKSPCFRSQELRCTTCHVAHTDARRADAAFYNAKCTECHTGSAPHHQLQSDSRASGNCIGCHMPYVELHPGLHFTDHFIRVVKKGDLPPETIRVRDDGATKESAATNETGSLLSKLSSR
jgi:hypothetical protein